MTERNDAPQLGLPAIPAELLPLTDGATWEPVSIGASGALVYRLRRPGAAPRYLKIAPPPLDAEARDEAERLAWLHGGLPVPEALAVCADATATWLLLSEVPGVMSCEARFASDVPSVARLLAQGLRMIHRLDIAVCPFDRRLVRALALARERCAAGMVDEADFDEQRQGMRAPDVLAALEATRPAAEDLVFTHGDYCLPNVFLDPAGARLTGFVDWGRAGVADRYQDLALAARSLRHNFGPGWESYLFVAYGLTTVDTAKLAYYELLDELF